MAKAQKLEFFVTYTGEHKGTLQHPFQVITLELTFMFSVFRFTCLHINASEWPRVAQLRKEPARATPISIQ